MARLTPVFLLLWVNLTAFAQETLYVGTYSVRGSEGVYVYSFDRDNNSFELVQTVSTPESPSFLAISPDENYLYSTNRGGTEGYPDWGSVSSFSIDEKTSRLSLLNEVSSYGVSPCHVAVDDEQNWLYISHYGGGSLSVFPVEANGKIGNLADSVQHTGSSVNPKRQEAPHVHSIQAVPQSDYFLTADLGLDEVKVYQMNGSDATEAFAITTEPGSGPRHFTQSADNRFIYIAEELTSTVSVHTLDPKGKKTGQTQRVSTLPDSFADNNTVAVSTVADIHLSPDGKFLYVSNRGHNSLAIYEVDERDGTLTPKGHQSTQGETPRNFAMDPQGEFVLVANQNTDNIAFFERDQQTGQLTPTDTELSVPSPVCLILKSN
ncbi:lactonase family protein [Tunicatimonas pelagia]|uniref:lactonase family protein n=1 Tax=Tunicatimonas pelagia TaxID=931531 RepID=UPI0026654400|nr:lactonase family protein [Tunicatimonas pelagia]WKN43109.1 lactonase family protein [Tunicatimonas pelagia]